MNNAEQPDQFLRVYIKVTFAHSGLSVLPIIANYSTVSKCGIAFSRVQNLQVS